MSSWRRILWCFCLDVGLLLRTFSQRSKEGRSAIRFINFDPLHCSRTNPTWISTGPPPPPPLQTPLHPSKLSQSCLSLMLVQSQIFPYPQGPPLKNTTLLFYSNLLVPARNEHKCSPISLKSILAPHRGIVSKIIPVFENHSPLVNLLNISMSVECRFLFA